MQVPEKWPTKYCGSESLSKETGEAEDYLPQVAEHLQKQG
jgi:hypothetical protein